MAMSREEELRLYEKLRRELVTLEKSLESKKQAMRGLKDPALLAAKRDAAQTALEIDGMKNTIRAIRLKHGLK